MTRRSKARALAGLAALGLWACSDGGTAPQVSDLNGVWNFTESSSIPAVGLSCNSSGTVTIQQNGSNFTGSYSNQGSCSIQGICSTIRVPAR